MKRHNIQPIFSRTNSKSNLDGFTIIELLVATTIFSIVLVVIVSSFLQIGRMFYKGVSINNTNETARSLVDEIANDVRLSSSFTPIAGDSADSAKNYFCVGPHRYTFKLNTQVKSATDLNANARTMTAGMVQDTTYGDCRDPAALLGANARQILGPDMRLNAMDISKTTSGNSIKIHAHIIFYGIDDTVFASEDTANNTPALKLKAPDAYCSGGLLTTQFCAMADIKTSVTLKY